MVALAAKNARIVWALLAKGERYRERALVPAVASPEPAGPNALTVGKGKFGLTANGQEPGSRHSALSSRVTARRNDWNSIRDLHQGQRSTTASKGRIHDRSRPVCRSAKNVRADRRPSIHDKLKGLILACDDSIIGKLTFSCALHDLSAPLT